jgi:hypothetical protein
MRTSRCSCGECSVEVEGEPVINALCNCDDCRRRTGAPFGWSIYFFNDQVRNVSGPLKTRRVETDEPHARWFCSECGSTLFWREDAPSLYADQTGFAGGCFNDPTMPAPNFIGRFAQRMSWAVFPPGCEISLT